MPRECSFVFLFFLVQLVLFMLLACHRRNGCLLGAGHLFNGIEIGWKAKRSNKTDVYSHFKPLVANQTQMPLWQRKSAELWLPRCRFDGNPKGKKKADVFSLQKWLLTKSCIQQNSLYQQWRTCDLSVNLPELAKPSFTSSARIVLETISLLSVRSMWWWCSMTICCFPKIFFTEWQWDNWWSKSIECHGRGGVGGRVACRPLVVSCLLNLLRPILQMWKHLFLAEGC